MASEIAEENSTFAKKLLKNFIGALVVLQLILWIDGIPFNYTAGAILCHVAFTPLLRDFPFVEPLSISTFLSAIAVVLHHYIWFHYFATMVSKMTLWGLIGFFVVFVWALPAGFFISLTLAEDSLPGAMGMGSRTGSPEFNGAFAQQPQTKRKHGISFFKQMMDKLLSKKDDVVYSVAPGMAKHY